MINYIWRADSYTILNVINKTILPFIKVKLTYKYTTCLGAATCHVFFFGYAVQSTKGAGSDACRFKIGFYPFIAAVALDHLAVGNPVSGGAEGTRHCTAPAAYAVCVVIYRKTGLGILAYAARGT